MKNNTSGKFFGKKVIVVSLFSIIFFGGGFFISNAHADNGVLGVTQISAVQTYASADGSYANGWKWIFNVTVPTNETALQMRFADWTSSVGTIPAANNLQFYSSQSTNAADEAHAIPIAMAGTYGNQMYLNPSNDLNVSALGNQIQITLEARVPVGSIGGSYSTSYGINASPDNSPTSTGTNPPVITNIQSTSTSSGATITWTTDGYGDSEIYFGTASGVYASSTGNSGTVSSGGTYSHSVELVGLNSSTTYYYKIASTDNSGNRGVSDEYSLTTQSAPVGSLTATQNSALGTQNVVAGASNLRIGSFSLAASPIEAISVNNLSVQISPATTTQLFENLKVFVGGAQFGITQAVVGGQQVYTFSGAPFTVPAGGSVNVDVYADTLSNASGTYSPATELTGSAGIGQTSHSSVVLTGNSINGQTLIFNGNSQLTVAIDSSNPPASQIVQNSTGNALAVFRLTETSNVENVKVTQLNVLDKVASSGVKAAFSNVRLWNGSTLLGTAASPVWDASSTGWSYNFNSFVNQLTVPQGGSLSLTLKGDAGSYTAASLSDNTTSTFEIASSSSIIARGAASNRVATIALSNDGVIGNPQTTLRTTVWLAATPVTGAPPASFQQIGSITLTANSSGDAVVNNLTLTFSTSSPAFLNTVVLKDPSGNDIASVDHFAATSTSGSKITWIFATSTAPIVITGGTSYTLALWGDLSTIPPISNQGLTLAATISSVGDFGYLDGTTAGNLINLTTSQVPITVSNLSSGAGLPL